MEKQLLNYRIIIDKETYPDSSLVYVAHCPTLGISDYGDTVEDVLKSIKEGIELAVESLSKEKQEVPIDNIDDQIITSTKVYVSSRLPLSFT
ncbi:hypothetical protein CO083_06335 [Candidatus Roizmanbacteria bacterium CG_4_9_14_0_8_um_filter_34_12]|uniref:HicB-like antitoxin of toxin-antitoxin system domain-containing protein n=4 Tax=Candidatus Roizmaniibacteriota TaxID=1752723 RepID=A0A2M7E4V3_9BACT|nr:MAG: hypothetical protein COW96_02980 [Candidatus Roizmanbacteria bacterium CG22_combo_CG10-13_8_21_14_all_33_16]PIV62762.1 MAG: hypothetical protein COS12_01170 [Candidatus Roizmanbacteria bacterium CG01_land_8_20_14_3_00_33_9]PIX73849.1 MAG: hypothetical protein COZ39_01540 [Candidatus Roizmanbacteria bacterium CG_4_10_14_3_um_filter_33_21]PJB87569.1 MAG: hypothetical protein CO083_06335 [Candidatus Roizmanbacteria bacterium CG_4_9_14_0_8_um_filter_34_12]